MAEPFHLSRGKNCRHERTIPLIQTRIQGEERILQGNVKVQSMGEKNSSRNVHDNGVTCNHPLSYLPFCYKPAPPDGEAHAMPPATEICITGRLMP